MRVSPSEISFVVQGPVVHAASGGTRQVCASICRFFPGAEIVLSTWQGTDARGVDADRIVLSQDPGQLIPGRNINLNRQLVSSREGIRHTSRSLVMKTRSDILFTSDTALDYWDRWNEFAPDLRLFHKRVLIPNTFTFKPTYFNGHAFHPSDWCFLGLREDIEFLFDVPLCPLEDLLVESPPDPVVAWKWSEACAERYSNEQYLWLAALQKRFPHLTTQMFAHLTPESLRQTELAFANNFVALNAQSQFGIFAPKYPKAETVFGASNLLNHTNWQGLYDAYCAADPPALPACGLDDLRAANGDFRDWKDNDPRFTALRRAGHAWEAMLLDCVLRLPADLKGWSIETLLGTEQKADNLLALALWAKAHLLARLALPSAFSPSLPASGSAPVSTLPASTAPLPPNAGMDTTVQAKRAGAVMDAEVARVGMAAEPSGLCSAGIVAPDLAVWQERGRGHTVTVCMAARLGEPLTRQCLEHLAQQTCPHVGFLLFLNGGARSVPSWLSGFLNNHPAFLLVRASQALSPSDVWNYCLENVPGDCVVMTGAGDLLNRTCVEELVTMMQAHPHIAVGRAALGQGMANGATRFLPLKLEDTILSAGDALIAGLHHGAFTRSPAVQIFRRSLALQSPVLCDAHFVRYALEEFALRLMIPGGLAYRAGRCGVRPPHITSSAGADVLARSEVIERFRDECALKIHALQEFTRSKALSYNRTFVGLLLLRLNTFCLVDQLQGAQGAGGGASVAVSAALEQIYRDAAIELRVIERGVSVRAHEEAIASYERGDTVQALAQLESLVASSPYYGPAHNDLSVLLYDRGECARALTHSKQAVAIAPNDADALKNMAFLLAMSHHRANATQAYRRLLAIAPNDPIAVQALAALGLQAQDGGDV